MDKIDDKRAIDYYNSAIEIYPKSLKLDTVTKDCIFVF